MQHITKKRAALYVRVSTAERPLQFELPLDDYVAPDEISDTALYNLFFGPDFSKLGTEPPWHGPGPNFLAEFRNSMTAKEHDALLDEAVEALERAIYDGAHEREPPPKPSLEE